MYHLGKCYECGRCVEQNEEEGIKWYHKAAENGNVNAMEELGMYYTIGICIEGDLLKARKYYLDIEKV